MTNLMAQAVTEREDSSTRLVELEDQEKRAYVTLSTLVDFVNGHKTHKHKLHSSTHFGFYKRGVLAASLQLNLGYCDGLQDVASQHTVTHYKKAILSALDSSHRNLVILSALKDTDEAAIAELVAEIREHCQAVSGTVAGLRERLRSTF